MTLCIGEIVRTSYHTGPMRIIRACGPYTDPSFIDQINSMGRPLPPSEPHFCLVCEYVLLVPGRKPGMGYLNGYRLDGTSVWSDDYLIFESVTQGVNLQLFAAYDFRGRETTNRTTAT